MESLDLEQLEVNTRLFNLIRKKVDLIDIKKQNIKKLLAKTPAPDVNASDGNYNNSTPLHMAIRRNELDIVELLISLGADVTVQDRDKLTPLELAEKLNCSQSIIAALKPKESTPSSPIGSNIVLEFSVGNKEQTRRTINKKYVREFDLRNDDQWSKIEVTRRNGTFKILRINNATVNDAFDFILSERFIKTFNDSTHLFFMDIRVDNTKICINNKELELLEKMLDPRKPLVIQWRLLNSSQCCIFYKEPYGSVAFLQEQNWEDQPKTTEDQQVQLTNELDDNCQFPVLLKMLHHGLGGSFHGNLMETELDVLEEIESWKLIDYAAKSDDALSLRYLQLFNWPLHKKNTNGSRTMEIACEHASPKSISAILDLPDTNVPHELLPICWQRNVLKLKNLEGSTPVLIATQCGKTETLYYLINCGVKENCIEAIELAWGNRSYDKVVVLLDVETPFPDNFDADAFEDDNLRNLLNLREHFHQAIREGATDEIGRFIKEYPHLKQVLNTANQSALRTARAREQWDTYLYLQSEGFRYGSDEDPNLKQEEKENLMQVKQNYFHKLENSWITFLLSRSKLGHDGHGRNYFGEIRELYEQLEEIPYARTVLRVLEMSSVQQIVFDFNKESAVDLDPTLTETTAGSCDYVTGNLYIGAKQPLGALLGTLAHELTHFAMQTVFNNDCNPYMASDIESKSNFQKIVDGYCERKKEMDSIIEKVYNYEQLEWPSELIVRVPHIMAHYSETYDEKRSSELKDKAPDLFEFYDDKIEKPFKQFIANSANFKNQHLNDLLRQIGTTSHPNIRFKSDAILCEDDINRDDGGLILAGSLPQLLKIDLLQALEKKQALSEIKSCYIFTSIDQFENQDIVLKIRNSFKSNIKQTLVVDCSSMAKINGINKQMLCNTLRNFNKQKRFILISHTQIADLLLKDTGEIVQTHLLQREYGWSDLDTETQAGLLTTRNVDFQGYPVTLDKLISTDSEYARQIPLSHLIEGSPITIGKPLPISYGYDEDYYIERTFKVATDKEDLI
ncbi:Ankyrin repeat-containing protein, partial [Oryctes borbonicus]